jgi:hypothetical protein
METNAPFTTRALLDLDEQLARKYPGVSVEALMLEMHAHPDRSYRQITFRAPRAVLVEMGLVPCDGRFGDSIDEWGTRIVAGRQYAIHFHNVDAGAAVGRLQSQHPDNRKTREAVSRLLARFAKGVSHG